MEKSCLILDTHAGGLELDIKKVFQVQVFESISFNPGRIRIAVYLFLNKKRITQNYTHLSCGGFWQLIWAQILIKNIIIVVPGIAAKYHKIYSFLNKIFRSAEIHTCDYKFHKNYGAKLYTNYERINVTRNLSTIKTIDVLLVGRNDKNKRFLEFVDKLMIKTCQQLNIVHLGSPPLQIAGVKSLGQVENSNIDNYFRLARTHVVSSLYESSPRVVGEALRNGVPCAMISVGNLPYIFGEECCNDLDELALRVNNMLKMTDDERVCLWKKQVDMLNMFVDDCTIPVSL